MRTISIYLTAEIPDGATTGPDYGNETLTPEFVRDYLTGAYVPDGSPMSELVPGLVVSTVQVVEPQTSDAPPLF